MKFIKINKRILDYGRYRNDVKLLNRIVAEDIALCLESLGFVLMRKKGSHYCQVIFYNHSLDLEVTLVVKKKSAENFI